MKDENITVDGCEIRYIDTGGQGPVLFLTHGIGASLETWEALLNAPDRSVRIIAWDLPGHGLSSPGKQPYDSHKFAVFAWSLLDVLNVDQAFLAGNSLGAAISLAMASFQPRRVLKLMLLNAASLGKETPLPFRLMCLPVLGGLMSKPNKKAIQQQINAIFLDSDNVAPRVKEIIERNVMRPGNQKAFLATLRQMTTFRQQSQYFIDHSLKTLAAIQIPVLFIHGREDAVIPLSHSVHAQGLTAGSELLILENCGHTPQIEKPEIVLDALQSFIAK